MCGTQAPATAADALAAVTLNPDGTKTAVHPRGWRTLHSNSPPAAA
jgi:hypothetical protein